MPDPKRKIAPADATRVKPASKPDVSRLQSDLKADKRERDMEAASVDSVAGRPAVVQEGDYRAAKVQKRMDARADSIVQTRANTKKVAKDLFDVEDDVDNMRKT